MLPRGALWNAAELGRKDALTPHSGKNCVQRDKFPKMNSCLQMASDLGSLIVSIDVGHPR